MRLKSDVVDLLLSNLIVFYKVTKRQKLKCLLLNRLLAIGVLYTKLNIGKSSVFSGFSSVMLTWQGSITYFIRTDVQVQFLLIFNYSNVYVSINFFESPYEV